jgi:hypothetical protein
MPSNLDFSAHSVLPVTTVLSDEEEWSLRHD